LNGIQPAQSTRLRESIEALRRRPIAATEKGFGGIAAHATVSAATLAALRPPALGADFTMPLLVLRDSAVAHNILAMAAWCARAGVRLAPHGKTAMAPQLIERQLAAGAWGVTAATISQVQVLRSFGVQRVLLANQLTDQAGIRWLAAELAADPDFECYVYVDSPAGVALLDHALRAAAAPRPLNVLVELGYPGGRTGCRTIDDALATAAAVASAAAAAPAPARAGAGAATGSAVLSLAGVAGYEGGIGNDSAPATLDAVAEYCRRLRGLARTLWSDRPPATQPPGPQPPAAQSSAAEPSRPGPIITAGGSAYFDVVARELTADAAGEPSPTVVLRSGCYLTHDHGQYARIGPIGRQSGPELIPALELWASVLSRPEPGLALAGAGRRDVSFDLGMPVPLRVRRADGVLLPADQLTVTRLDDQHAYLSVLGDAELAPGDLVCLGISHPCTTFDKWRVIPVVDDAYRVIDAVHTFF
jgi:D-serine deaminase-like pyridoxal phosphate-dependent protein